MEIIILQEGLISIIFITIGPSIKQKFNERMYLPVIYLILVGVANSNYATHNKKLNYYKK